MTVAEVCRAVQSRWRALAQLLWPESPEHLTRTEVDCLSEELRLRFDRLIRRRQKIESLRDRLAGQQRRLLERTALLLAEGRAEALAPALERLRRAIERNQGRLSLQEAAYTRQRRAYERRKRLRLALERGEVVVVAAEAPACRQLDD